MARFYTFNIEFKEEIFREVLKDQSPYGILLAIHLENDHGRCFLYHRRFP